MSKLANKIDFAAIITVNKANPNGDPLNGNRPREDYDGLGEMSDVCIKRKIRNRLQDMGQSIFVQSHERSDDGAKSLNDRARAVPELVKAAKDGDIDAYAKIACEKWIDVRAFGQVFAFKSDTLSVGVRGPVSVQTAVSADKIDITSMQITKSVNSVTTESKTGKSSDTMGTKNRVEFGLYIARGSINCQLAEKTGFSEEDAELIKEALMSLFENDASSARPEGSMEVRKLYWWKHNCPSGQYSSAKVQRSLIVEKKVDVPRKYEDYEIRVEPLDGLVPEEYEGR